MNPVRASIAALLIVSCNVSAVSISGRVENFAGNAVAGARITLFTPDLRYFEEERTNTDGKFVFDYVAEGTYRLGIAALRHEYQETTLSVSNRTIDLFVTLQPETNGGRWSVIGSTTPELLDGSGSGTLLPTGDVFFCHDSRDPIAFEPIMRSRWYPPDSGSAQGCHMVTLNTDGGLMLFGGSDTGNPQDMVLKTAKTYWRNTNAWVRNADMFTARWYAGLVRLPDERLLVLGGELADPGYQRTNGCEIYDPRSNSWSLTGRFNLATEIPPAVLLFTGEVLKTWRYPELYNIPNGTWRAAPNMIQARKGASFGDHADHEIVNLPDGRVMAIGVAPVSTNTCTRFVEFYNPANNSWTLGPNPRALRNRPEALILADGRVLAFGGQYSGPTPATVPLANAGTIPNCTKVADLFDPELNGWRPMADLNRYIHYHNVTVMAPDGRVIATGGAGLTSTRSFAGDDDRIEAFEPPYLFRGVRPRIDELSTTDLVVGSNFTMRVSLADAITEVVLVSARATTHWVDGGPQRYLSLDFTQNAGVITATVPNDPVKALAGWYILFVLVDDIPSVGKMVRVTPTSAPKLDVPNLSAAIITDAAAEGGGGIIVEFSRTGPNTAPLMVPLQVGGGTAIHGADYAMTSNVVFGIGASTSRVNISTMNDLLSEGTETATLALANTAYTQGATNFVFTIGDNEPVPAALSLSIEKRLTNEYTLTVLGPASRIVELHGSQDLRNWNRLGHLPTAAGTNRLTEVIRAGEPFLFFRLWHP